MGWGFAGAAGFYREDDLDEAAIDASPGAVVIGARTDAAHAVDAFRTLGPIARDLAASCKGWVHVLDSSAIYTPGQLTDLLRDIDDEFSVVGVLWTRARAPTELGSLPYLLTEGMNQLGLPELLIEDVSPAYDEDINVLLYTTAQALWLRGDVSRTGALDVDVTQLGSGWTSGTGGTGKVTWRARWAPDPELEGSPVTSPADLVIKLDLPGSVPGAADTLVQATVAFFGEGDNSHVETDADHPDIVAAAERARSELRAIMPTLNQAMREGDTLVVTARFVDKTHNTEWVPIDVARTVGTSFEGTLANRTWLDLDLAAGSRVTVPLAEIDDYVLTKADGTTAGNYLDPIIERLSKTP